jgi:hypothetical protein
VLIMIPDSGSVLKPLPRYGLGAAWLAAPAPAALAACPRVTSARPSTEKAAFIAEQHGNFGLRVDAALPLAGQVPTIMTRLSATGAGAMGPHPEREPEPV